MVNGKLVIDLFAGGGGASEGMRMATGHSPDIAVDSSPEALGLHAANHPGTRHICADIWSVDPIKATGGQPVALLWASPPCTHFSRARSGKKKEKAVRGLAWSVCRWAAVVRPDVIIMENVPEFASWGPLGRQGKPIRARKGETFRKFVSQLEGLGYRAEWEMLTAAGYGVPTMRKRLFLVARRDGRPIAWPEPTHGPAGSPDAEAGRLLPYEGAYAQIGMALPCQSIFGMDGTGMVRRPPAKKTVGRIAEGVRRFVTGNPHPYLIQREGGGMDAAFIIQQQGQSVGTDIRAPLNAITAGGMGHMYLCLVRLVPEEAYGQPAWDSLSLPAQLCASAFPGPVTVQGVRYRVKDVGMRILEPMELYRCQGFLESCAIGRYADGEPVPKAVQVRLCGNAVCPPVAAALVRANLDGICKG
ncbi:MAG: DNA cytosine methyltransferase [Ruminococcus flavefaciens]|nr:DNA cytosine methyltransferase [Ruminococcus flavefaciens]